MNSVSERGLQARQLALERAIDDHITGVDHGTADQRRIHCGRHIHLGAEALAQRGLDGVQFGAGQFGGRGRRAAELV